MFMTVIRHGESYVNVIGTQVKSMDSALTEKGQDQAMALDEWFKAQNHFADVLYTSTMRRALETTGYLADTLCADPIQEHRLREIPNVYAGGEIVLPENMARKHASDWANKAPFIPRAVDIEGSESWMHFRIRVGQFMDDMVKNHMNQNVYVVAHGGVISAMFDNVFNVGPHRRADVHNYNTSWSRFQYRDGIREHWYLWDHNRVDHLIGKDLL